MKRIGGTFCHEFKHEGSGEMYILQDGTETTRQEIEKAHSEGKTILVWSHRDGHNAAGLMLDGIERDTRGECYSMWDEVWTSRPETLEEALEAARCEI